MVSHFKSRLYFHEPKESPVSTVQSPAFSVSKNTPTGEMTHHIPWSTHKAINHHVATNGPLSDLKPQGSFHVSQSSTVSGQLKQSWYGVIILGDC